MHAWLSQFNNQSSTKKLAYIYTCTCVYQWSSVLTANYLGVSERCSESESDNSHSYVCNNVSLNSEFLLACGMVCDVCTTSHVRSD